MSCKYCELRLKDGFEQECGEKIPTSYYNPSEDPYIRYEADKKCFELLVSDYDNYCYVSVDGIKFCPMCGDKLVRYRKVDIRRSNERKEHEEHHPKSNQESQESQEG